MAALSTIVVDGVADRALAASSAETGLTGESAVIPSQPRPDVPSTHQVLSHARSEHSVASVSSLSSYMFPASTRISDGRPDPHLQAVHAAPSTASNSSMARRWTHWLPSQRGMHPRYMRSRFRTKTFGLLTLQFAVVLSIMLFVEWNRPWSVSERSTLSLMQLEPLFCMSFGVTAVTMLALYCFRDSYPQNYVLLGTVTLLIGFSWGMDSAISPTTHLHDQLMGILGITTLVATITSALLASCTKFSEWQLVSVTLSGGWIAGSIVDLAIAFILGIDIRWAILASIIALLLMGVMLLKAGALLVQCDPDDFMSVIVAMDFSLFLATPTVLWILPFLVLSESVQRAYAHGAQPAAADNQARHQQEGQAERDVTSAVEHARHGSHEQYISSLMV